MLIEEKIIETVLSELEEQADYRYELMDRFEKLYEEYLIYLEQEIVPMLTEHETDVFFFIHSVITESFMRTDQEVHIFDMDDFFDAEETMWAQFEDNIKLPFRDRITPVYNEVDEEDALAFVEDLLVEPEDDEEEAISASGRDIIWNVCAAFISVLTENSSIQ